MDKRYQLVWDFWTFREGPVCIKCWGPAVTLHEIIPRSRYRKWEENVLNSVPVCAECHDILQKATKHWEQTLWDRSTTMAKMIMIWKGMTNEDFRNLGSALRTREDKDTSSPDSTEHTRNGPEDAGRLESNGSPERPNLPFGRYSMGQRRRSSTPNPETERSDKTD